MCACADKQDRLHGLVMVTPFKHYDEGQSLCYMELVFDTQIQTYTSFVKNLDFFCIASQNIIIRARGIQNV